MNSNIKTLDLSKVINVTAIGEYVFYNVCLESIKFGETSNVTTIGNYTFYYQRDYSGNGLLSSILIKIAEEDFLANVTVGEDWYDNALNPTITYDLS